MWCRTWRGRGFLREPCLRGVASRRCAFLVFFVAYAAVFLHEIPRYGLTWDVYAEFPRAAAYVEWLVSGRATPDEVPPEEKLPWGILTYEQAKASNTFSANGCLPSLCAALTGKLFYQRLHWLGPIDAYHLGLAVLWLGGLWLFYVNSARVSNRWVAALGTAFLALSPRLFEDAHNNMKDVPSTLFGAIAVLEWLSGIVTKRPGRVVLAGVWFGISLASKHTSLLLLLPMGAVALFVWLSRRERPSAKLVLGILGFGAASLGIAIGHLPYLWVLPPEMLLRLKAIREVSALRFGGGLQPTIGVLWLVGVTTPPTILAGAIVGIPFVPLTWRHASFARRALGFTLLGSLLTVLGFWSLGLVEVFDGIRNFEHYWPFLALVAASGWMAVLGWAARALRFRRRIVFAAGAGVALLPIVVANVEYRSHQIAYFNVLVGGLPGAQSFASRFEGTRLVFEPVDYWGSSLRPCIEWANANLPEGARVVVTVASHLADDYTFRKGLHFECQDAASVPCEEVYVISLGRSRLFGPCDRLATTVGTPVYEESVAGIRLAGVFRVPGGWNACHRAPKLSCKVLDDGAGGRKSVQLHVHCEPCASGQPLTLYIGRPAEAGGFEGIPHNANGVVSVWAPWRELVAHRSMDLDKGDDVPAVPAAVGPGGEIVFTLPLEALARLMPAKASTIRLAVVGGPLELGLVSDPVEIPLDRR